MVSVVRSSRYCVQGNVGEGSVFFFAHTYTYVACLFPHQNLETKSHSPRAVNPRSTMPLLSQPTAKEVFLEMLVDHLLEVGGAGGVVPWYNVRIDLFLDKVRWGGERRGWEVCLILRGFFFHARQKGCAGGGNTAAVVRDGISRINAARSRDKTNITSLVMELLVHHTETAVSCVRRFPPP